MCEKHLWKAHFRTILGLVGKANTMKRQFSSAEYTSLRVWSQTFGFQNSPQDIIYKLYDLRQIT